MFAVVSQQALPKMATPTMDGDRSGRSFFAVANALRILFRIVIEPGFEPTSGSLTPVLGQRSSDAMISGVGVLDPAEREALLALCQGVTKALGDPCEAIHRVLAA